MWPKDLNWPWGLGAGDYDRGEARMEWCSEDPEKSWRLKKE